MNDIRVADCPACGVVTNNLLISIPTYIAFKSGTTLGSLAEQNRKALGKYGYQETVQRMANERSSLNKYCGYLPEGATLMEKPADPVRPWFRTDSPTPDMALLKATDAQIDEYIETGKRPPGTN
jgi:hypothetical protein